MQPSKLGAAFLTDYTKVASQPVIDDEEIEETKPKIEPKIEAPNVEIEKKETKSKHMSIMVYPSIHKRAAKHAKKTRISTNDLINRLLDEYLTQNNY